MAINTSFSIPYGQEKGPSPSGALWSQAFLRGQERASRERELGEYRKIQDAAQKAQEAERLQRMRVMDVKAQMEQLQFQTAAKAAADRAAAIREIEADVEVHGDTYGEAFMRRAHRILPPREYGDYMAKIAETTPEILEMKTFKSGVTGFEDMPAVVNRKSGAIHPFPKAKTETERLPADEVTNREIDKLKDQARKLRAEGDPKGAEIAEEQAKRRTDAMIPPAVGKKEQTEEDYILANLDKHIEARKSLNKSITVDEAIAELRDAYRKAKSTVIEDEFELDITTGILKKKK